MMNSNLFLKITGVIAVCFFSVSVSYAQVKFGFRAGVNISNQEAKYGDLTIEPKSKFGLDLAVVSDIALGEVVSFGPELHWLQKGFKIEDLEINGLTINGTSTLNYLELPLLVKFNFGETTRFFVMAGPSLGYLISENTEDSDGNEIVLPDHTNIEFGAHLGAGVGIGPVVIDLRYILGISNLAKDEPEAEIHNTSFGGGISLMF